MPTTINAGAPHERNVQEAPPLPLTYYASKRKMLLLLIGCLAMVALFCWMIMDSSRVHPSPRGTKLIGFLGTIFFGLGALLSLYMLFRKLRIVTLTEAGLLVGQHKRWIGWAEIKDIRLVYQNIPGYFGASPREIEWIGIFLKDTSSYYTSWGPINRRLYAVMERKLGTPILIGCTFIPVEPDSLIAWMNDYRAEYSK